MSDPILPGKKFNDGLRKAAGFVGSLLFAAGKAAITAAAKDLYACEWNIDDKLRIRKLKQADGKPGWIVYEAHHREGAERRIDYMGDWKSEPSEEAAFEDIHAQWRDDTEFDSFEEAARFAAEYIKEQPGGKG
jgi:hypothetical protein